MSYAYSVFGLRVQSEIELPELPLDAPGDADVTITRGPIQRAKDAEGWLWSIEGAPAMEIDGVARFWVRDGNAIRVDPDPAADGRDVRVYLLGSAMGLLLHQRGLLPLHANAVEVGGGAAAFVGASGAGKSTLAGWFHDQGLRVLADDVCAVHFDASGKPLVSPGLQRLRLWRDALERTGRDPAAYQLSFTADGAREKFDVPLPRDADRERTVPLGAIYLLDQGEAFRIAPLTGVNATEMLFANTYRGGFLDAGDRVGHWRACVSLAQRVPIFRVERVWGFPEFEGQNRQLLDHLASLAT